MKTVALIIDMIVMLVAFVFILVFLFSSTGPNFIVCFFSLLIFVFTGINLVGLIDV